MYKCFKLSIQDSDFMEKGMMEEWTQKGRQVNQELQKELNFFCLILLFLIVLLMVNYCRKHGFPI